MMSWRMECEDSPSAGEFRQGFGPHIVRDSAINHPPSFKMPHQLDARVQQIIAYLAPALALLAELADAVDTPFLPLILTTVQNLIAVVQTAKRNRAYCIELMSDIHQILLALIGLHLKSDASGCLPPSTLHHVGKFTQNESFNQCVLHKIYTYINAQQERKSFQAFFQRRGETSTLLESCRSGLREAVEVFKIDAVATYNNLEEMKAATERMQTELLELIASTSEGTLSEQASAIYSARGVTNSSNSFSMLPSKPQIFHGRDSELAAIIKILKEESPRIAILGGGGMGKTTLARAVLHHENTTSRFERTIFVTAESVNTSIELAARVALYLGLEPGRDSTKSVINCLRKQTPCLLILDNLETPWEPGESRPGVEEFLSAVTSLPQIALIITMRGSERPGNVRWSHPFLSPLGPLSDVAARQTFAEVADESLRPEEIDRLLQLTDNMPLAVDLIAHLVDYEGASSVLARWETERTSLLVAGEGHVSNLDTSIDISISSPRMTTAARELLSLLSVLPDGLAYVELIQITNLPIVNVLACQTTLLATALAYRDNQNRLRSLVPVREHVQRFFPPSPAIIRPLRQHFHSLLELYREYNGVKLDGVISRITSNLGNLQNILRHGLRNVDVDSADTIHCTISLSSFARITGIKSPLMDCIPPILHQLSHHSLEVQFATELLSVCSFDSTAAAEVLIADTRSHLQQLNQPVLECRFWRSAGTYFHYRSQVPRARECFEKARALLKLFEEPNEQCSLLMSLAWLSVSMGDYSATTAHGQASLSVARSGANLYQEARALRLLSVCSKFFAHYEESIIQLKCASQKLQMCGLSGGYTDHHITLHLGDVYLTKSEFRQARAINSELARHTSLDQNGEVHAHALMNIAYIDVMAGAPRDEVQTPLDTAQKILLGLDYTSPILWYEMISADLELREGNYPLASSIYLRGLTLGRENCTEIALHALERLSDVTRWGTTGDASWAVIYLAFAKKTRDRLAVYKAILFLGDAIISGGDELTASSLFSVALQAFTVMDVHYSRARCLLRLGDVANRGGNLISAFELWELARTLFEKSLQSAEAAQVDARMREFQFLAVEER